MTTPKPIKAREFWIRIGSKGSYSLYEKEPEQTPYGNSYLRVIEYSAYQKAIEALKKIAMDNDTVLDAVTAGKALAELGEL